VAIPDGTNGIILFSLSPVRLSWYLLVLSLAMGPLTFLLPHGRGLDALAEARIWVLIAGVLIGFLPKVTKLQRKAILLGALLIFLAHGLIFIHF
jgi:hypothetical protein